MKNFVIITLLLYAQLSQCIHEKYVQRLCNNVCKAIRSRNKSEAKLYVKRLAKLNPPKNLIKYYFESTGDEEGYFHDAISMGATETVKTLIRLGIDVNTRSIRYTRRPLHEAALSGQYEIAKLLIKNGAKIDCYTADGKTPLIYACIYCNKNIAMLLIKHGAQIPRNISEIVRAEHKNLSRYSWFDKQAADKFLTWLDKFLSVY